MATGATPTAGAAPATTTVKILFWLELCFGAVWFGSDVAVLAEEDSCDRMMVILVILVGLGSRLRRPVRDHPIVCGDGVAGGGGGSGEREEDGENERSGRIQYGIWNVWQNKVKEKKKESRASSTRRIPCHHKWPWTITKRQFANNLHALARVITYTVLPIDLVFHDQPVVMGFVGMASGCIMFSQQFHAWAHGTKSKLPAVVVALQDAGVLVSRSQHAAHHKQPYNNNYCIVSGVWNRFLDDHKVFEALEMVIYFKLGLRPRSWSEPNSDWTEEAEDSPVTYVT
ncbi:fatty acid desaturase 4, chloroplastic-like [Helianthus annuus]|nr:fatty acid desaturase 4, chloroplastic-like [Helianthus annuus]